MRSAAANSPPPEKPLFTSFSLEVHPIDGGDYWVVLGEWRIEEGAHR